MSTGPGGATTLTLVHERLEDLAAGMPDVGDKVELGWVLVLEKLAVALGARGEANRTSRAGTLESGTIPRCAK